MPQVQRVRTPFSMAVLADVIRQEWPRTFPGVRLDGRILALVLALVDLEVAGGESSYNWNLGNMVQTKDDRPWFSASDRGNQRKFVAFGSLAEGARALVKQLMSTTRPQWRDGLLSGDPTTFVHALGGQFGGPRYFEADVGRYLDAFMGRWEKYRPTQSAKSRGASGSASEGNATLAVIALGALVVVAALSMAGGR